MEDGGECEFRVGGVSGRAGGEVRGWVGLLDELGVGSVSKSGWGSSGGVVIDFVIFRVWLCSVCTDWRWLVMFDFFCSDSMW